MGLSLNGKPESGISNNHSTRNGTTQKARRKISPGFCIQRAKLDKLHVKGLQNCALNCAELRAALVQVFPTRVGVFFYECIFL